MNLSFYKYHGAGNDFIVIDNRKDIYSFLHTSPEIIKELCSRHFGIGADGLMLLNESNEAHFSMDYFNADGYEGTMCGNGGRCIALFAHHLKIVQDEIVFTAVDGLHKAVIINNDENKELVKIKMIDVHQVRQEKGAFILNTGSPHYVEFIDELSKFNAVAEGKKIRYNQRFAENGVNVNFVDEKNGYIFVRTYERGVENETLACGTGVAAAAIASMIKNGVKGELDINVKTLGGELAVTLERNGESRFENIWLQGPARKVFKGEINL